MPKPYIFLRSDPVSILNEVVVLLLTVQAGYVKYPNHASLVIDVSVLKPPRETASSGVLGKVRPYVTVFSASDPHQVFPVVQI